MLTQPRRVPVRYFLLLRDLLRSTGVDTARILETAGIDPSLFERRDSMLTSAEVDAFILAASKLTGRDDLGFELGRRIKMNSHELLGYGLISCPNLDAFLRMSSRHYHLMVETWNMRYIRKGSSGECIYTPTVALPVHSMRFYLEALAVAHQNQLQLVIGPDLPAFDIYISMPEPDHLQRYLALSPARFYFDEATIPGVRAVMPAELLDIPLALGDVEVMHEIDKRCAATSLRPSRSNLGWGEYVMMVLREARGGLVTLEDIAKRANVSARTIDRHLQKEGIRFRELADKVRFERACEMLCATNSSIMEVASQLGFSDTANFTRSFRRVVGVNPGEYRRQFLSSN